MAAKNSKNVKNNAATSAPENWLVQLSNIKEMRALSVAPVDIEGCTALAYKHHNSAKQARFACLVSLVLSSQTKDEVTSAAVDRLNESGYLTPQKILDANLKELEAILKPVSFYKRKATSLKKISSTILQNGGDIPDNVDDLKKLPGVGPKMAYLTMQCAWNNCVGIGVDTHVHRISNRLQWVKAKTPEKTRMCLESWLPKEHWADVNKLFVGFGQTICRPLRPKCKECLNKTICPSSTEDIF